METPQPSATHVRESKLRNHVATCELPFSGLTDVRGMQGLVESSSGYSLARRFQFGLIFALMEPVATMSALCDIEVEISCLKSKHSVRSHEIDDRSGWVSCNQRGLSATGEPLHDPDTRMMTRSWDADAEFRSYPLARSGGVAAAW